VPFLVFSYYGHTTMDEYFYQLATDALGIQNSLVLFSCYSAVLVLAGARRGYVSPPQRVTYQVQSFLPLVAAQYVTN
jgi:hypothetical protein